MFKPTILTIIPLLALAGCQQQSDSTTTTSTSAVLALRVTPIKPERKTLIRRTEQPGEVHALEVAPLIAKVTGYVRKVHVDIGDRVTGPHYAEDGSLTKSGQLLAELDVPELAEEVKQKQAVVTQAAASVKVADAAKVSAEAFVSETQAMIERVEATYRRWEGEYERVRKLAANSAVTAKVADETEQQFRSADAARRETTAKIKSAQAKLLEAAAFVEKSQADLKVANADADKAHAMWNYTQIRAPFDGIVSARDVDTGHLVSAATPGNRPLFVVVKADTVRIRIDIPEADAALVQNDAEVRVRIDALGGKPIEGRIARTAWVLYSGTRTLRVEIDLPNADGRLRPGMSVNADVLIAKREDVLALSKSAVLTHDGQAFCLRVDETTSKLVKQPLRVGLKTPTDVEILEGLSGQEQVIGTNVAAYKEGQTVEVVAK